MKILALDMSLTSTGVAYIDGTRRVETWKVPGKGMTRLARLRDLVLSSADAADLVVLEGYSYASRGRAVVSIGELGGVIRLALHTFGHPYVELAPSVVKKLATGKGNAGKELVLVEAVKRLGYGGSSTDEADALWLLEAARQHYGISDVELPKTHLAALEKVTWPIWEDL